MKIEEVYQNNFKLIKEYKLTTGKVLKHKDLGHLIKIVAINPFYGWVVCEYKDYQHIGWRMLHQDLRDIKDWEVVIGDKNGR